MHTRYLPYIESFDVVDRFHGSFGVCNIPEMLRGEAQHPSGISYTVTASEGSMKPVQQLIAFNKLPALAEHSTHYYSQYLWETSFRQPRDQ